MSLSREEAQWLVVFMRSLPGTQASQAGQEQASSQAASQEAAGWDGYMAYGAPPELYESPPDYAFHATQRGRY